MNTDIEHASLRQEINENATHALNVTNVVLALLGLAVVAAFEFRNPYVVLLPLMSLYYGRLVLFNNEQRTTRRIFTPSGKRFGESKKRQMQIAPF